MLSLGSMGLGLEISYIIIGAGVDLDSSSCFLYCTSLFLEHKARDTAECGWDARMPGSPAPPKVPEQDFC